MTAHISSSRGSIYIIRHGRTAANARRYAGWDDEPLDPIGRADADKLAVALADRPVDSIFSSPLSRAYDTATPLARSKGLTIERRQELIELNFGELQGLPKQASAIRIRHAHLHIPIPGGESLADVAMRAEQFFDDLLPRLREGQSIALVSHFWTCRVLLGLLIGSQLEHMFTGVDYKPKTGSVLEVPYALCRGSSLQIGDRRMLVSTSASREGEA